MWKIVLWLLTLLCLLTKSDSSDPTPEPTPQPTLQPTPQPTLDPSPRPTRVPTPIPTLKPSPSPSPKPTRSPTPSPTPSPTSFAPTPFPTGCPSGQPSSKPSDQPTSKPSDQPSRQPSSRPSRQPTGYPSECPSTQPTGSPTGVPTHTPPKNIKSIYFKKMYFDYLKPGKILYSEIAAVAFILCSFIFLLATRWMREKQLRRDLKRRLKEEQERYADLDLEDGEALDDRKFAFWKDTAAELESVDSESRLTSNFSYFDGDASRNTDEMGQQQPQSSNGRKIDVGVGLKETDRPQRTSGKADLTSRHYSFGLLGAAADTVRLQSFAEGTTTAATGYKGQPITELPASDSVAMRGHLSRHWSGRRGRFPSPAKSPAHIALFNSSSNGPSREPKNRNSSTINSRFSEEREKVSIFDRAGTSGAVEVKEGEEWTKIFSEHHRRSYWKSRSGVITWDDPTGRKAFTR